MTPMRDGGPAALELHRVAKLYGRTVALRSVSLSVDAGQTLVLLGPNGSGKTSLLKIVAGAVTPTVGRGSVFGQDMATQRRELRSEIGLLASETYLYDDLTALENLRFITTMAGKRMSIEDLHCALRRVDLPPGDERVRGFSSGMKRRLALARLLLLGPRLLLLDEPYNSLDAAGADLVDDVIHEATREGRAAVLATHAAARGLAAADLVGVLDRGAMTYFGPVAEYRMEDGTVGALSGGRGQVYSME